MLMSAARISCGVAVRPRFGPRVGTTVSVVCVAHAPSSAATAIETASGLNVDIFHAPVGTDAPRGYRIVMKPAVDRVFGFIGFARRLHVAFLVDRAALQLRRLTVPVPWQAEAHEALRQCLPLQRGIAPCGAPIERDLDPRDPACAAPREP